LISLLDDFNCTQKAVGLQAPEFKTSRVPRNAVCSLLKKLSGEARELIGVLE